MSRRVLRWTLTGGIGSGKSTVAGILRGLGIRVIDADRLAHEAYQPGTEVFDQIALRWPDVVVDDRIDRRRLGQIVFEDQSQLRELESLVHPAVRRRLHEIIAAAEGKDLVVEISVPEPLVPADFRLVVVDAPDDLRRLRLAARGLGADEIRRRMGAQPPRTTWLQMADLVIDNSDGLDSLEDEVRSLVAQARSQDSGTR